MSFPYLSEKNCRGDGKGVLPVSVGAEAVAATGAKCHNGFDPNLNVCYTPRNAAVRLQNYRKNPGRTARL